MLLYNMKGRIAMSKKVLILSSSPRKGGNSDVLCDEFMKGAVETGNTVEKIFLRDKKINYCIGCGLCTSNGYSGCSQKDDMEEILDKMLDVDVIVMASPVYFYTIDAQMKTLIDRCCAKYTKMLNKEFYFIVTAADDNPHNLERAVECFRGFTDCLTGAAERGVIYAAGVWNKGEINETPYIKAAYDAGKSV